MGKISEIAKGFIGKREVSGNKGFVDKAFDKAMRAVGFYTGAPWCGFFAMLVYSIAGDKTFSVLTASAVRTMKKADAAGNWHTVPVPDAVVIYRTFKGGKPQSTGHIGIVTAVNENGFDTVEGNTTDKGGREGLMVAVRTNRSYKWDTDDGLRLMGFIYPQGEKG